MSKTIPVLSLSPLLVLLVFVTLATQATEWCSLKEHKLCPHYCCREFDDHFWQEYCCSDCEKSISQTCPGPGSSTITVLVVIFGVVVVLGLVAVCLFCVCCGAAFSSTRSARTKSTPPTGVYVFNAESQRASQCAPPTAPTPNYYPKQMEYASTGNYGAMAPACPPVASGYGQYPPASMPPPPAYNDNYTAPPPPHGNYR